MRERGALDPSSREESFEVSCFGHSSSVQFFDTFIHGIREEVKLIPRGISCQVVFKSPIEYMYTDDNLRLEEMMKVRELRAINEPNLPLREHIQFLYADQVFFR